MTDEELVKRADAAWHRFRRVELYRGDPEREAAMKDELVNYIPLLTGAAQRLLDERAALVAFTERLADGNVAWDDITPQARALLGEEGK